MTDWHIGEVAQPVSERRTALADELFDVIDTNGDGKIDSREMQAHLLSTGYSTRTVDGIFNALDMDDDGTISRDELRNSFSQYDFSALRLALGFK